MKKLMVAASAAALSAAVFADVYNVKFTASTLVDADGNMATRKVKGETEEYYKKNTVTVNGVYDDQTGETYFWTGSGKKMAPVQSAVLEITNEQEMDELKRTDAGKAVNVGLYIGQSDNLTSYFVSGGIGKGALNTKNKEFKEWTADLASASGSFGGTWYGYPAYGSWSFSKNATATKNGIAEYVNKQGKSAGITTASWTGTSDIAAKLEKLHEAVKEADTVSAMIKQIAALTGTNIDQASTIAEKDGEIETLKADSAKALEEAAAKAAADLEAALAAAAEDAEADKAAALAAAAEKAQADLEAALAAAGADKDDALAKAAEDALKALQDAVAAAEGSYVDELKALDNESFVGVTETISDYLKETIEKQTALSAEAGEKLTAANDAIAAYEEAVADDYTEKLLEELSAASNAVDAAKMDLKTKEKAVEDAEKNLTWLDNIKNGVYAGEYESRTNDIVKAAAADKTAKQDEIDEAAAHYEDDVAALKGNNDTLIDVTLPGETNELATVTIPALEDAKAETAADYEDAVAAQTVADEYLAEYTTEDGEGNYAKYLADNGLEDSGETRLEFKDNVYPAMKKDAADAAEATTAAKEADEAAAKNLADAEAELAAKTKSLDALIAAREKGELAEEIQKQLDDRTAEYEADKARLEAELAAIGTKEAEDLAVEKKAYEDSYTYERSDKSLDEAIADAEKAVADAEEARTDAEDALVAAEEARNDAEGRLADVPGTIEALAEEVKAIIGVRPDAEEGYEEAREKFFADWSALSGTTGENVAAARAILARLGKSVD